MKDLFEKEIIGFIPEYIDSRGNCTILYRKDLEPLILDKNTRTVLNLIGKHYMIDLKEIKNKYRPLMSSKNLIPIPLGRQDILIPFKVRVPLCKNDGAFGYINMKYIKDIKKDNRSTRLILHNGLDIKCLSSLTTVEKHMRNGKIVSSCYQERSIQIKEYEAEYKHLIPASKADIEMLYRHLKKINSK